MNSQFVRLIAMSVLLAICIAKAFADPIIDDIRKDGAADVIVLIDAAKLRVPQLKAEGAVAAVSALLSQAEKASFRRLGKQAMIAGPISELTYDLLTKEPGVRVVADTPSPPLTATARKLVGLDDVEQQPQGNQTPPAASSDGASRSASRLSGFAVAVLDTGFDTTHRFIKHAILRQACFSTAKASGRKVSSLCPNGYEMQTQGEAANPCAFAPAACEHGTHVAGLIAGQDGTSGSVKFDGISPETPLILTTTYTQFEDVGSCIELHAAKTPCYGSFISDQVEALEYVRFLAYEHFIGAVNMSLGSPPGDCAHHPLAVPVQVLLEIGIPVVAAAGNGGQGMSLAPGCLNDVIDVAASDQDGKFASKFPAPWAGGSNFSQEVDVVAPGVDLMSAAPGGKYVELTGTSQAAPLVAAAIARVRTIISPQTGAPPADPKLAGTAVVLALRSTKDLSLGTGQDGHALTRPALDLALALRGANDFLTGGTDVVAAPAGATETQVPAMADVPSGSRNVVDAAKPFTKIQIQNLEGMLSKAIGEGQAQVLLQSNPNRVIVDTVGPIDKRVIQDFTAKSGNPGIVYEDAIGSFKF